MRVSCGMSLQSLLDGSILNQPRRLTNPPLRTWPFGRAAQADIPDRRGTCQPAM
jgi:hypothetical protein